MVKSASNVTKSSILYTIKIGKRHQNLNSTSQKNVKDLCLVTHLCYQIVYRFFFSLISVFARLSHRWFECLRTKIKTWNIKRGRLQITKKWCTNNSLFIFAELLKVALEKQFQTFGNAFLHVGWHIRFKSNAPTNQTATHRS